MNCDRFERRVIDCLLDLGHGRREADLDITIMGDSLYMTVIGKRKAPTKKGADLIRWNNAMRIVKKAYTEPSSHLFGKILEMRAIALMRIPVGENAMEIIIAIRKFIARCRGMVGKSLLDPSGTETFSPNLIEDLRIYVDGLGTFSGMDVYRADPRLFIYTDYDDAIPGASIRVRSHQARLVETIRHRWNEGKFNICYNAGIGSGKTSSIVALAAAWNVMFICRYEPVRAQVARLASLAEVNVDIRSEPLLPIPNEILVFIDEPTEADWDLLHHHGRNIWSSAQRVPWSCTDLISDTEIQIGCTVRTMDGRLIVPHQGSKNLKQVIDKIALDPFLARLYTIEVAYAFDIEIDDIPPEAMNANSISHKILAEFWSGRFEIMKHVNFRGMALGHLGTQQEVPAGMTLVSVSDPWKFARENFGELALDVLQEIRSVHSMLKAYQRNFEEYQMRLEILDRNIKNEDELARKRSEIVAPQFDFPSWGRIGSIEHAKKYQLATRISNRYVRLETLGIDTINVDEVALVLLMAGVGIYDGKDSQYSRIVLDMAMNAQLTYLIAPYSVISHGANYAIDRVIVMDMPDSVETLFQLMGRAGRVGKSWKAEVFIVDEIVKYIMQH